MAKRPRAEDRFWNAEGGISYEEKYDHVTAILEQLANEPTEIDSFVFPVSAIIIFLFMEIAFQEYFRVFYLLHILFIKKSPNKYFYQTISIIY